MYDISNVVYKTTNGGSGRFLSFSAPTERLRDIIKSINPYVGLNGQMEMVSILPVIKKPYFRNSNSIPVYAELKTEDGISTAHFSTVDEQGNRMIQEILRVLGMGNLMAQQVNKT